MSSKVNRPSRSVVVNARTASGASGAPADWRVTLAPGSTCPSWSTTLPLMRTFAGCPATAPAGQNRSAQTRQKTGCRQERRATLEGLRELDTVHNDTELNTPRELNPPLLWSVIPHVREPAGPNWSPAATAISLTSRLAYALHQPTRRRTRGGIQQKRDSDDYGQQDHR